MPGYRSAIEVVHVSLLSGLTRAHLGLTLALVIF